MFKEWETEPDRLDWESNGFCCSIQRHESMKHLCGYIGIPEGHPWYEKDYSGIDADVHGGLTFARYGTPEEDIDKSWYKRKFDNSGKNLWWIGFDCAHLYDLIPGNVYGYVEGIYKNINYVKHEVEDLALQASRTLED